MRIGVLHIDNFGQQSARREGRAENRASNLRAIQAVCDVVAGHSEHLEVRRRGEARTFCFVLAPKRRGESVGRALLDEVRHLGMRGTVGIADDRLTAHLAARGALPSLSRARQTSLVFPDVSVIPVGGSLARIAQLPIAVLELGEAPQMALQTLGVHTIGEFAKLPAPSTARHSSLERLLRRAHALVRGEEIPFPMMPPAGDIIESVVAEQLTDTEHLLTTLRRRIDARLAGRSLAAERVRITLTDKSGDFEYVGDAVALSAHQPQQVLSVRCAVLAVTNQHVRRPQMSAPGSCGMPPRSRSAIVPPVQKRLL